MTTNCAIHYGYNLTTVLAIQFLLGIWTQLPCVLPRLELHWPQHVTKVRACKFHTLFLWNDCRINFVDVHANQLLQDSEPTQLAATLLDMVDDKPIVGSSMRM